MSEPSRINISDLVVVDFPTQHLTPEMAAWKERNQIPSSMSCARQVWYGEKDDFVDFPFDPKITAVHKREGTKAYAFLLSFAAGFENEVYDTHNRAQFFQYWNVVQRSMPETAAKYTQFIRNIELDSNLVHVGVMSDYRKPAMELAARDLGGQKKGQNIWIVGNLSRSGCLTDYTKRLITATEQKQRQKDGHDGFITLTHPDPKVVDEMRTQVAYMKLNPDKECSIRSNIQFADFTNLLEAVETQDHIYVDIPMGSYAIAEDYLIEAWKTRKRTDNTLTHVKGSSENKGGSIPPWSTAQLDNYFSPEDVRAEVLRRNILKKELWTKADTAFHACAALRAQDIKPDKPNVFGKPIQAVTTPMPTPAFVRPPVDALSRDPANDLHLVGAAPESGLG